VQQLAHDELLDRAVIGGRALAVGRRPALERLLHDDPRVGGRDRPAVDGGQHLGQRVRQR
jgi:hypothetical protein